MYSVNNSSNDNYRSLNNFQNNNNNGMIQHQYNPNDLAYFQQCHENAIPKHPIPFRSLLPPNFEELSDDGKLSVIRALHPAILEHNQSIYRGTLNQNTNISNDSYCSSYTFPPRAVNNEELQYNHLNQFPQQYDYNGFQQNAHYYPVDRQYSDERLFQPRDNRCYWNDLPSEIEELIISTTINSMYDGPMNNIVLLGLVSKSWNKWLTDYRVWRNFVEKSFGVPPMWFRESSSLHNGHPLEWLKSIFKDEATWLSVLQRLETYILQCSNRLRKTLGSQDQTCSQQHPSIIYNNHNVDYNHYYQHQQQAPHQYQQSYWMYGPLSDYYAMAAKIKEFSTIIKSCVFDHDTHTALNKFFESVDSLVNIFISAEELANQQKADSHDMLYLSIFNNLKKTRVNTNDNNTQSSGSSTDYDDVEKKVIDYHQQLINLAMDAACHLGGGDWNVFNQYRNTLTQNLTPRDPDMDEDDHHHNPLHHLLYQKKYWGTKPVIWPSTMRNDTFLGDFDDIFVQLINWISSLFGYSSPPPSALYKPSPRLTYEGTSSSAVSCVVDLSIHQSVHFLPLLIGRTKFPSQSPTSSNAYDNPSTLLADRHIGPTPPEGTAQPQQSEHYPGLLDRFGSSGQLRPEAPTPQSNYPGSTTSIIRPVLTPSLLPVNCRNCYRAVLDMFNHFDKKITCDACCIQDAVFFVSCSRGNNGNSQQSQQSQQQRGQQTFLHQNQMLTYLSSDYESDEAMVNATRVCDHDVFFFCANCSDAFGYCRKCTRPIDSCQCCTEDLNSLPAKHQHHHHHFTPQTMIEYKEDKSNPEVYLAKKQSIKQQNEKVKDESLSKFMEDCKKFYDDQLARKESNSNLSRYGSTLSNANRPSDSEVGDAIDDNINVDDDEFLIYDDEDYDYNSEDVDIESIDDNSEDMDENEGDANVDEDDAMDDS